MRSLKTVLLIVVMLAVAGGLGWNWRQGRLHPGTEDADLSTDVLQITPQAGGRIFAVEVAGNDHVTAGQTLFTIDTARLETARAAAQAQLDLARNGAGASGAAVAAAEAALRAAETQSRGGSDDAPAVRATRASREMANLDLAHATVTAPADSWIAALDLRPGQVVNANVPQFTLVEDSGWWVDDNFKETDLHRIRPGQPATVEVDMYPGLELSGHVVSIGAGSGASFSLLPAQNATGNWVKVTQRFTVRIALDDAPADPAMQLRLGTSSTVTVDTTVPVDGAAE